MTAHFNYKLTLKSGEIYENTDGGSVGIVRDIFLEDYPGKPVTLTDYNDLLDKSIVLFNERELSFMAIIMYICKSIQLQMHLLKIVI